MAESNPPESALPASDVTHLLKAWRGGDHLAFEQLAPLVEDELRRLARIFLIQEGPGHTLQPTALVNEAYLRLIEWKSVEWQSRAHFFAVAAKIMRRVLVNQALAKRTQKRGGDLVLISLSEAGDAARKPGALAEGYAASAQPGADLIALDEALNKLAAFDPQKSQLVELHFFGGLDAEEVAEVTGRSVRSIRREWTLTRAWLFKELSGGESGARS
jgi:RNA polymerase sigma factor (TIGR02999 family)